MIVQESEFDSGGWFCRLFEWLLIMPILGLVRKWSFETSRWKDSMFSTSGSSDDSDDSSDYSSDDD